jgi:(2Fe-2S) ferredoxin
MNRMSSPYRCHIFICVNDRQGARKSCADGGRGPAIKDILKEQVAARGWKGQVRVSQSGCMGLCERGSNVMIYPQGLWFSAVTPTDTDAILEEVAKLLKG